MSVERKCINSSTLNQPDMSDKKFYKSICLTEIGEDILVFHLGESHLDGEELVIIGLAQFIEYVEYKRPPYVIINKRETRIKHIDTLQEYLRKYGIDALFNAGVKKVCFIVSEERMKELASKKGYRGIEAFTDLNECLEEIMRHRTPASSSGRAR